MRFLMLVLIGVMCASCASSQSDLDTQIGRLGTPGDNFERVYALVENRQQAMLLLADNLTVTSDTVVAIDFSDARDVKTEKMIWNIRALRYLTGQRVSIDMESSGFDNDQQRHYFEAFPAVSYFGHWKSRGVYVLAPVPEQKMIISEWKVLISSSQSDENVPSAAEDISWYE